MTEQDEAPVPTARVKRIEVEGLFGLYDHVIDLNLEDRVTILHGPNGVGKTVLLKMIRALLADQSDRLAAVSFHRFRVEFTSGEPIDIHVETRTSQIESRRGPRTIATKTLTNAASPATDPCTYTARVIYPDAEIFEDAGMPAAMSRQFPEVVWQPADENPLLWDIFEPRAPCHLIGAQRVLSALSPQDGSEQSSPSLHPAVWGDAISLQRRLAELLRKYGAVAQALDQSFPSRLLQRSGQSLGVEDLKTRMTALERLRAALQESGILDESRAKPFNVAALDGLSEAKSEVMTLYVEDNEAKLGIFSDFLQRVSLFRRILNGRFRNKSIRADHRHGLLVTDDRGDHIELRALSSGEQQQIVLAYALLFRVPKGALVLIDEPELSLHVLWQKRFLPDLLEIVRVAEIDALLATHSPFIVGDRSDLMVALDAEIDHDEPLQP